MRNFNKHIGTCGGQLFPVGRSIEKTGISVGLCLCSEQICGWVRRCCQRCGDRTSSSLTGRTESARSSRGRRRLSPAQRGRELRHALQAELRARLHLPVAETLHITHVLLQAVRGLLVGASQGWQSHLLRLPSEAPGLGKVHAFTRVEFQDGTRKAPTQEPDLSRQSPIAVLACTFTGSIVFRCQSNANLQAFLADTSAGASAMVSILLT
jgi:hypothetical protein